MHKASEQRIYIWPTDWKGEKISPATLLTRTVWNIITPFFDWGYVKWKGKKVSVKYHCASIWHSFNVAMDVDWSRVTGEVRGRFEADLAL